MEKMLSLSKRESVMKVLSGYTKKEVVEIVERLFKAENQKPDGGYGGGKKRRLEEQEEEQPPEKKRLKLNGDVVDSLRAHIHPFLEKRPPPKIKMMTFAEAIDNLSKPKLNQKTKSKATQRSPRHSRTTLPLSKPPAANGRRPTKISAFASERSNTEGKSKRPSVPKKEIPRRISRGLHGEDEHQAPASKLPATPMQVLACEQSRVCFGKSRINSIVEDSARRATPAAKSNTCSAGIISNSKSQDQKQFGPASNNVKHKEEAEAEAGQLKIIQQKEREASPKHPATPTQGSTTSDQSSACLEKSGASSIVVEDYSPRRAAHAAELKKRFAGIISKSQGCKRFGQASTNLKQMGEEAAAQLKSNLEREREAARLALCKVEEAADGRKNMEIFEELKALCECDLQKYPNGYYPLQQFGLILKQ